ncbi:MAG: hypothetical protein AB7P04_01535 [Bacteriovoracia bacterium]
MKLAKKAVLFHVFILAACGLRGGGSVYFNDPVPSGSIVAQGSFSGRNNQTVTGSALIYQTTDGTYVIRLQSLSAPDEAALKLYATVNGTETLMSTLKGSAGNQNYTTSVSLGATWSSVSIRSSSANPSVAEYGIALLSTP